ncbi:hypothetical protein H0A71_18815 [Alcaligenaceae bacterium]|nr:hypothetical protein [Alcaligenaceae bacterium]
MPTSAADLLNVVQSEIQLFRDFVLTLEHEARLLSQHADDDRLAENTTIKTCLRLPLNDVVLSSS